jgi:hypothetical protein
MKIVRIIAIVLAGYVALGLTLDGLIGLFQPEGESIAILRTFDDEGRPHERRLAVFDDGGTRWVESGHHFRGWYHRLRKNPDVELIEGGKVQAYRAVPVDNPETVERVKELMKRGRVRGYYISRFLLLFAEIKPVRLDPR